MSCYHHVTDGVNASVRSSSARDRCITFHGGVHNILILKIALHKIPGRLADLIRWFSASALLF